MDYIHISFMGIRIINNILRNPLLDFKEEIEKTTKDGVLYQIKIYTYLNLKFVFTGETDNSNFKVRKLSIQGSFHYYYNKGKHNANDFSFINFKAVVNDLKTKFNISPYECKIHSLEYGINFTSLEYDAKKIIQNYFYNGNLRFLEPINKPHKQAGCPKMNDLIFKAYVKSAQFPQFTTEQIIRYELKFSKARGINKLGIYYLSDLLNIENHIKLQKLLQNHFKEILFYDNSIKEKETKKSQQKNIPNYKNPIWWIEQKEEKHRNTFRNHKQKLKDIIHNHSENIQRKLLKVIQHKCFDLLNQSRFIIQYPKKSMCIYPTIKTVKMCASTHLYKWGKCNNENLTATQSLSTH